MASFTLTLDTSSVERYLAALGTEADASVRPVAQKGAQVFYDEARANAARIEKKTGRLAASIYQAYSPRLSGQKYANYHVSWRTKGGGGQRAPHGHLIENGHWRYYVSYIGKDGKWHTMVRPEMRGKKPPRLGRDAKRNRALLNAYYVPLPGGPRWVSAIPFMRPAFNKAQAALDAMERELFTRLGRKL